VCLFFWHVITNVICR